MKAVSLRSRLTFILLGLTLLGWFASVVVAALYARQLMVRQVDVHLERYADMAQHTMDGILADAYIRNHFRVRSDRFRSDTGLVRVKSFGNGEQGNAINLWFGKSQILVGENSPALPMRREEGLVTNELSDGSKWRTLYRYSTNFKFWWAVAIDLKVAMEGAKATFNLALLPLVFLLPITGFILMFGIGRGLQPLHDLAHQISTRRPNALESFRVDGAPTELRPVMVSLNDLLDRLQRALTSERRFTSNAAHELQTPLAAIQVAVQSSQRQLENRSDCRDVQHMLQRVASRVSDASDTVKQLLTLARLDPEQEFNRRPVDLPQLTMEVIADVGGLATDRDIAVRFNDQSDAVVNGNAEWLKILLRNLFVNAFKYSTPSSEVEVSVDRSAGYVTLIISNDCEPIPEEDFRRLTERFYHLARGDHGVGLGLSIVQRIAELHGAELRLHSWRENRGFCVELQFLADR